MSGEEGGLSDIRSQGAEVREDGEKPIRVGYASGRYDAVERGRMVTSIAGVSAIQGSRPDFASSSRDEDSSRADQSILGGRLFNWRRMRLMNEKTENDARIWTPAHFRCSRRG